MVEDVKGSMIMALGGQNPPRFKLIHVNIPLDQNEEEEDNEETTQPSHGYQAQMEPVTNQRREPGQSSSSQIELPSSSPLVEFSHSPQPSRLHHRQTHHKIKIQSGCVVKIGHR